MSGPIMVKKMAGAGGIEPPYGGIKIRYTVAKTTGVGKSHPHNYSFTAPVIADT